MEAAADAGLPGNQRGQRSSLSSFIFIIFLLFMLMSHNGDELLARHQYQDSLRLLTYQLANFTAWLNMTDSNFTMPDQNPALSPILDAFQLQSRVLDPTHKSYYANITGFIHGASRFYNITPHTVQNDTVKWSPFAEAYMAGTNLTQVNERVGNWNWTASTKVALSVVEKKPTAPSSDSIVSDDLAMVHGRIELTDANTSEDLRLEFEGIHFISNGSIHGIVEAPGLPIDIRLLPSLVPSSVKNATLQIIAPELEARINKLKNLIDAGVIDQDSPHNDEPPKSTCPFKFHAQLHPVPIPEHVMQELESEIQIPTGIWTVKPPKLSISGLLLSKECGILLELTDTEGLRSRMFFRKVTTYAGLSGLVYFVLLVLFIRQSNLSRTPSGVSRVSRWTFLTQATVDSVSFAGHITFAIIAEGRPSLSLIAPAFLACILFIQEAQFSVLIHQIQAPENVIVSSQPSPVQVPVMNSPPSALATENTDNTSTITNNTAPAPPTQPPTITQTPSFFAFFIQHVRTDPQARLWFALFICLSLVVRVILSPTLSMVFVGITYSSIWLPQILRSARRGRSSGLSKEYIFGTTICRLYSALYFLACPKNVLDIDPRPWSFLLTTMVCLQALVIVLQEYLGPNFFIPAKYVVAKVYDYHPPLAASDPESPDQGLGDCAICMDTIYVERPLRRGSKSLDGQDNWDSRERQGSSKRRSVASAEGLLDVMQAVGGTTARKNYSLAPCHHLFHTECLEKWLAIKNICPQCRRPLPPL